MENKEKVYIVLIVVLVLALGITIGLLVKNKPNSSDGKENSNNSSVVEEKKEITSETKKELANIVGLTENGYERYSGNFSGGDGISTPVTAPKPDTVEVSGFTLVRQLADMSKNKEVVIKDSSLNDVKSVILKYAMANKMLEHGIKSNSIYAGSGEGMGVSFDNYKKIAKKYNLSQNGEMYFDIDRIENGYYLYDGLGTTSGFATVKDSMKFERKDKDIILTYDIALDYSDEGPENTDETMTFTFKQYDDGTYYLHSVKTVNK